MIYVKFVLLDHAIYFSLNLSAGSLCQLKNEKTWTNKLTRTTTDASKLKLGPYDVVLYGKYNGTSLMVTCVMN